MSKFALKLGIIVIIILSTIGMMITQSIQGYSYGTRTGKLVKLSKKGLLCKTWEGELLIGEASQNTFAFTVNDNIVVEGLKSLRGEDVTLEYSENYYTGSCSGDTNYFITAIK